MHSEHFSEKELACKHCGENRVTPELLDLAEKVRSILGVPMIVHCAYRCPIHNAEVGGVSGSTHVRGMAMDFHCDDLIMSDAYHTLIDMAKNGKLPELGGIGLYDWGLHIDCYHAADGHLRVW